MAILVSVIIPTYKRPQLLARCLHALACQRFDSTQYEIIVVSDGPDEQTEEAVLAYHAPVSLRFLSLPHKGGPAAARNLGWRMAYGELIAFTDDDCLPDPDWLVNLWMAYKTSGQQDIALTGRIIVPLPVNPTDYERNIAHLETAEFVTANCACSRHTLQRVNGFDEAFTMAWREDSDLHFKILEQGITLRHIPRAIVTHPVRKARWGVSIRDERKGLFNALLYKKYPGLYRKKIPDYIPWHYYAIVITFVVWAAGLVYGWREVTLVAFTVWAALTTRFIAKRLYLTSGSFRHVSEMVVTSLVIPFLSIYWRIYGALKFRVLFIR
jgi:glycosyltransferase involved in cell wall biosynthesis